ncbi:MAG: peptidoglycan-binding domain-containing protein [Pseudomonadota bacterium]
MTPADIGELQAMLRRLGLYRGPEDGVLGPRSRAAVDACLGRLPKLPAGIAGWAPSRRAAACRVLLADALSRLIAERPCSTDAGVAASRRTGAGGGRHGRGGMGAAEGA